APVSLNETGLKKLLKDIYIKQLTRYWPKDEESLKSFEYLYGIALKHLTEAKTSKAIDYKIRKSTKGSYFTATQLLISEKGKNGWIPCILYRPLKKADATVILTAGNGKTHWIKPGNSVPDSTVEKLLKAGKNVLTPDLFKQGEHILQDG